MNAVFQRFANPHINPASDIQSGLLIGLLQGHYFPQVLPAMFWIIGLSVFVALADDQLGSRSGCGKNQADTDAIQRGIENSSYSFRKVLACSATKFGLMLAGAFLGMFGIYRFM